MSKLIEKSVLSNVVVLGVNAWDEPKEDVSKFVKEHQLRHKILLDGSAVKERYEVTSIPTVFWIDREGIIRDLEVGFDSEEKLKERTSRLVKN